jgi:hypothetical protein
VGNGGERTSQTARCEKIRLYNTRREVVMKGIDAELLSLKN